MKRIITLLLALVTLFSVSVSAFAVSVEDFTDVKEGQWFYNDVAYAVKKGIVNGMTTTTFSPDNTITRAQFITTIGRWCGSYNVDKLCYEQNVNVNSGHFKDIPSDQYYTKYVYWADAMEIITGASADYFYPDAPITREDAAAMLYNYAMNWGEIYILRVEIENPVSFKDGTQIADYAKEAVEALQVTGVLKGDNTGSFNPKNSMKRSEYVALFARYMQNFEKGNGGEWEPNNDQYVPETPSVPVTYDWTSDEYVANMNAELERLINEARKELGRAPLTYSPEYQYGVDIRAKEWAEAYVAIGPNITSDQAHTRPDGSDYGTVYDGMPEYHGSVEALAGIAFTNLISPEQAANTVFTKWMNSSKGHKGILMASSVKSFACGIFRNEDIAFMAYQGF